MSKKNYQLENKIQELQSREVRETIDTAIQTMRRPPSINTPMEEPLNTTNANIRRLFNPIN